MTVDALDTPPKMARLAQINRVEVSDDAADHTLSVLLYLAMSPDGQMIVVRKAERTRFRWSRKKSLRFEFQGRGD